MTPEPRRTSIGHIGSPCPGDSESCPGHDGDPCNYEDHGDTPALPIPRMTLPAHVLVTRLRRWFWVFVRRWETEICGACGRPVCARDFSWWWATDALWRAVGRAETDVRCPSCFTAECRRAGYAVHWEPIVDYELCRRCLMVPEACACDV